MNKREALVLILVVLALTWRYFAYISFDDIGFIGTIESDTGVITRVFTNSPAQDGGLMEGDKILSVKGLDSNKRIGPDQNIEYTVKRNNNLLVIPLNSSEHPKDQVTMTRILGVMGVLILLIGTVIVYQIGNTMSLVFFLYCFAMAFHWGYFPQVLSDHSQNLIASLYSLVSIFLGSLILHFALIYPENRTLSLTKYYLIYVPGIIGAFLFIASFLNQDIIGIFNFTEFILVTLYGLVGYLLLIKSYIRTPSSNRATVGINVIFWGILISNLPYVLSTFLPFMDFGGHIGTEPYSLFFIFEPIAFAYGIVKVNKLETQLAKD